MTTRRVRSKRIVRRLERFGMGRVYINAHTLSERTFRRRESIVDALIAEAQIDVLRALVSGRLSIELLEAHAREHGLGGAGLAARVTMSEPLWPALQAIVPSMGRTEVSRLRYQTTLNKMQRQIPGGAKLLVRDLTVLDWNAIHNNWPGSASDWMHVRRLVSRFLTLRLGSKLHPVRGEVLARIPSAVEAERVPELSPEQFHKLAKAARVDIRPALWTLVLTGMRVGEYLRCTRANLRPATHAVAVPGTKTAGSQSLVRVDPKLWKWIDRGIPAPLAYKWLRLNFKQALRDAGLDETLRLHDLRHAHGQWAVEAGVPEALVQVSLRHAQLATTRRYTKQANKGTVAAGLAKALAGGRS